jgi:hypothetical protein
MEIGFGLNAKATIEPSTVFGIFRMVVVVGLEVVVIGFGVWWLLLP